MVFEYQGTSQVQELGIVLLILMKVESTVVALSLMIYMMQAALIVGYR